MSCTCLTGSKLLRCYRTTRPQAKGVQGALPSLADVERDMFRMRRALTIDGARRISALCQRLFESQIEAVIDRATAKLSRKVAPVEIRLGSTEEIWAQVIQEVLGDEAKVEVVKDYTPIAQSVIARSYESTCRILGEELAHDAPQETLRRARQLANKVTRINDTTRERLQRVVFDAVREGEGTSGVARAIRDALPEIAINRIPTIARNEVAHMLDQGTIQAAKESSVVKLWKVVGCKAREPNSPQFNGQSTCNITGVRPDELDKLEWHINHTGVLTPMAYWD